MGRIADRLNELARNAKDLTPLREPIRQVLVAGNREARLAGVDAQGRPIAPLAPSTAKDHVKHGLSTTPLVPHGEASRVIRDFVAYVVASDGRLSITGSWPAFPEIEDQIAVRRDVYGFGGTDLEKIRRMIRGHVMKSG